jgi:hypothetical protein
MNTKLLPWAAGLFEGEGSFIGRGKVHGGGRSITAMVSMTDEDVVRKMHAVIGLGQINGPYSYRNDVKRPGRVSHKPFWRWQVTSFENTQAFICLVWPWLCARRRERAKKLLRDYHEAAPVQA